MNRWTYKKFKSGLALAAVCVMTIALLVIGGQVRTAAAAIDSIWLADLSNPFVGQWLCEMPEQGALVTFDCRSDGTYSYEIEAMGIKGGGGYVAFDGILVTLDSGAAEAFAYIVKDNDTIDVTELVVGTDGTNSYGETVVFRRNPDSISPIENAAFKLDNVFLGKWQSAIPSAGTTLTFDYKSDGTFSYMMEGVPEDQGGKGIGLYIIDGEYQASYLDYEGAAVYRFEVADADNINVTELELDEQGESVSGDTALFTRVSVRPLSDWEGTWNSFYSYFDNPVLDDAYEILAEREDKSSDEVKARYIEGKTYQCEIAALDISDGVVTFYDRPLTASDGLNDVKGKAAYIIAGEVTDANGRIWTHAVAVDDAPYTQLLLLPADADAPGETMLHFHFRYGSNLDDLLSADGWYPTMVAYDSDLTLLVGHMTYQD